MIDLTGKVALVTGASQGIGLGIARSFLAAGASVHITGTRPTASDYDSDLSQFTYHQADLSTLEGQHGLYRNIAEIDVLVNNAGIVQSNEYEGEVFRKTIEMNLNGVMELCQLYAETLIARGGSVINIASLSAYLSLRDTPAYTASKAGLLGLTRALADQWARKGVRVNAISPGFIQTRMTGSYQVDPRVEKKLLSNVPMNRWGQPQDIGGVAVFLASPLAAYITGVSIPVDGGVLLR
ncbi:SDR family oxidoreductase [Maricurvus nonylphenolicus]|uniref:SDR family NAD(P)-dependent oxidoreductase n=1 Tax=Maricurvus nonylphenolicus TaxID=1008307 RepID=UPI0036F331B7